MKALTLVFFAIVLFAVASASAEEPTKKPSVWYHAPIFKKPWKQAKDCFKKLKVMGCWDDVKTAFGEGAKVLIDRHIMTPHIDPVLDDIKA